MITIHKLDIKSRGFQIMPILNYYDLTTADKSYQNRPTSGGIVVTPELIIEGIEDGHFYLTQVCKKHTLKITSENDNVFVYDTDGEELKDTEYPSSCHYHRYRVINNEIRNDFKREDKVIFHDTPFKELFPWWKKIEYNIEFQTYFQYSSNPIVNEDIIPLISFDWQLQASLENDGNNWEIKEQHYSNEEQIRKSIKTYSDDDLPLVPCDLKHLSTMVHAFGEANAELRKDFKKY